MIRKQAIEAVLRVTRLKEQQAAAVAQRERKKLNDAIVAANQLDHFADEYRNDLSTGIGAERVRPMNLMRILDFARKLESTAQEQRIASEPLKLRALEAMETYYTLRLRLDGLEKLERQTRLAWRRAVEAQETRETEDSIASRLGRSS